MLTDGEMGNFVDIYGHELDERAPGQLEVSPPPDSSLDLSLLPLSLSMEGPIRVGNLGPRSQTN